MIVVVVVIDEGERECRQFHPKWFSESSAMLNYLLLFLENDSLVMFVVVVVVEEEREHHPFHSLMNYLLWLGVLGLLMKKEKCEDEMAEHDED